MRSVRPLFPRLFWEVCPFASAQPRSFMSMRKFDEDREKILDLNSFLFVSPVRGHVFEPVCLYKEG